MITTALCAAMFFKSDYNKACTHKNELCYINHDLTEDYTEIFILMTEYLLDSFPVPVCDNIRIIIFSRSCKTKQSLVTIIVTTERDKQRKNQWVLKVTVTMPTFFCCI